MLHMFAASVGFGTILFLIFHNLAIEGITLFTNIIFFHALIAFSPLCGWSLIRKRYHHSSVWNSTQEKIFFWKGKSTGVFCVIFSSQSSISE